MDINKLLSSTGLEVHELFNEYDTAREDIPTIVYQLISKKPICRDNHPHLWKYTYQITLIDKIGSFVNTKKLEEALLASTLIPRLLSTARNDDYTITYNYEIEFVD
jgi:hypothetical protein